MKANQLEIQPFLDQLCLMVSKLLLDSNPAMKRVKNP
jgi:hypothetical protein